MLALATGPALAESQRQEGSDRDPMVTRGIAFVALHQSFEPVFTQWLGAQRQWDDRTVWDNGKASGAQTNQNTVLQTALCMVGAKYGMDYATEQGDAEARAKWQNTYDVFEFLVYAHSGALGDSFEDAEKRATDTVEQVYEAPVEEGITLKQQDYSFSYCKVAADFMETEWAP
ncbi:MAG: hypothetical protein AAF707_08680, partial [Pseudomonadota bacterium]